MHSFFSAFTLCVSFFLFFSTLAFTQGNPVMEIAYMRVPANGVEQYINLEQQIWKPIHQKRIDDGKLLGWYLLRVEYPGGTEADYNYVAINIYPSIADLDAPYEGIDWSSIHSDVSASVLTEKTLESRDMVRTEVFELIDEAVPGQPEIMPRFIAVNMMKVKAGTGSDYEKMERQTWKPLHQERIRQQKMEDWMFLRRILPKGSACGYNYITWDAYASYLDYHQNFSQETFKRIHPNLKMEKMLNQTLTSRTMVDQEMWSVVDYLYRSNGGTTQR